LDGQVVGVRSRLAQAGATLMPQLADVGDNSPPACSRPSGASSVFSLPWSASRSHGSMRRRRRKRPLTTPSKGATMCSSLLDPGQLSGRWRRLKGRCSKCTGSRGNGISKKMNPISDRTRPTQPGPPKGSG
jgi:hypothetical protein